MTSGSSRLSSISAARVLRPEALQSLLMEEHADLNSDANLRSSSLVSLNISVFTFLCSAVVLIVDGLTRLSSLEGALAALLRPRGEVSGDSSRSMGSS